MNLGHFIVALSGRWQTRSELLKPDIQGINMKALGQLNVHFNFAFQSTTAPSVAPVLRSTLFAQAQASCATTLLNKVRRHGRPTRIPPTCFAAHRHRKDSYTTYYLLTFLPNNHTKPIPLI